MPQLYEITVQATGEVRDADGNLLSEQPIESRITVTEEQLRDLGLTSQGDPS